MLHRWLNRKEPGEFSANRVSPGAQCLAQKATSPAFVGILLGNTSKASWTSRIARRPDTATATATCRIRSPALSTFRLFNASPPRKHYSIKRLMNPADIELGIPQEGYPALADWIAADPDNETFIFRKFDRLAARHLLALQAQLFAQEAEIEELERKMCNSKDISQRESARRWETLIGHAADPNRPEARHLELQKDIGSRLREYR